MKYIAITQRVLQNKKTGELRDALDQQWTVLLEQIGFIPLIIPNMLTPLSKLLKITLLNGVLFTGGNEFSILMLCKPCTDIFYFFIHTNGNIS